MFNLYELHFEPVSPHVTKEQKKVWTVLLQVFCGLGIAYTFILPIISSHPFQIWQFLYYLVPLFVIKLCKNHMEIAYIPIAVQTGLEVIGIITDLSSLFPLSLLGIISLVALVLKILLLASMFLSLFIKDVAYNMALPCLVFYILAESVLLFVSMMDVSLETPITLIGFIISKVVLFILVPFSSQRDFSGLKPIPIIAVFLICALIAGGVFLSNETLDNRLDIDIFEEEEEYMTCPVCDGRKEIDNSYTSCSNCNGLGTYRYTCTNCGGDGTTYSGQTCYDCVGNGYAFSTCENCGGRGTVRSFSECYKCDGNGYIKTED